jgi:hypothetical protein
MEPKSCTNTCMHEEFDWCGKLCEHLSFASGDTCENLFEHFFLADSVDSVDKMLLLSVV